VWRLHVPNLRTQGLGDWVGGPDWSWVGGCAIGTREPVQRQLEVGRAAFAEMLRVEGFA
jgi:hypothetical protein